MISEKKFQKIQKNHGGYASWAIWAEEGITPKSNLADLSVLDPKINSALLGSLHAKFIFLGLNISREVERPLGNFHDSSSKGTDFKIRYALKGTPYWGAYMTDIIKDFEEKASGEMMKYLKSHPEFEIENIQKLRGEISDLECESPTLVVFGNDAESIVKRHMGGEFKICKIPHYATYTSKEKYRELVINMIESSQIN